MNKQILLVGLVTLAACAGVILYQKYRVPPGISFQSLPLTTLEGKPYRLEGDSQKTLVVNFFATWCGPCVAEMQDMQRAQQLLNDEMMFVCISSGSPATLRRYAKSRNVLLPIVHSETPLKNLGIHTLPTTYLLDEQLRVIHSFTGERDWSSNTAIEELKSYRSKR